MTPTTRIHDGANLTPIQFYYNADKMVQLRGYLNRIKFVNCGGWAFQVLYGYDLVEMTKWVDRRIELYKLDYEIYEYIELE